ncbi:hypothetical protein OQ853_07540 [Enterobacter roggenkampii]|uniref:hypothetical protein n=1 Tax=Enterobacter roggenkampii TaxID=1812935 RepID=UPI00254DBFC6|nr:hypothetical protein [Enterobacter roggenkampii]MDK4549242.1 hypothetical protein [Enterobacter roggenkampii]
MMKLKVNERLEPNKKKEAANSLKSRQSACISALFRNITSGFKDGKVSYSETPSDFSQAVANLLGLNNVSASELSSIDVVVNDLSKKNLHHSSEVMEDISLQLKSLLSSSGVDFY